MEDKSRNMQANITNLSLSESLNRVINDVDINAVAYERKKQQDFDEIEAYASVDDILADLLKQYKDADRNANYLNGEFDDNDPMAEIAGDRKDSAWSAVQTRLLEISEDEKTKEQVSLRLKVMEEDRLGLIPRLKDKRMKDEEDFLVRRRSDERVEKREKENDDTDFLMFFLWMWLTKQWAEKRQMEQENRLQSSFTLAA